MWCNWKSATFRLFFDIDIGIGGVEIADTHDVEWK